MSGDGTAALDAASLPPRTGTIYPAPYDAPCRAREKRALGDAFGLTDFGVNLTTLPPGAWSAQRHWHSLEDEFVYVLEGELVLLDDSGETTLKPGMCAGFKAGVANGHHLVNRSGAPAVYLEIGSRRPGDGADYPDVDMRLRDRGRGGRITHKDGTPY